MEMERKALYNLLRMNAKDEPMSELEPWQVCDYRQLTSDQLFEGLERLGVTLDKARFLAFAESYDTPEDLAEDILDDLDDDVTTSDQAYLFLFELWRRFIPEKQSLSIFCDELDHCIEAYDNGDLTAVEAIQDAIADLQTVLDENVDEGVAPQEVFAAIQNNCANNIEIFAYDYISDHLDAGDGDYAQDVLEGLSKYLGENVWFDLLKARILSLTESSDALTLVEDIIDATVEEPSLELNLEILNFLVQCGDSDLFHHLVRLTIPLLEKEEDFQELLEMCAAYYACLDLDDQEREVRHLIDRRAGLPPETPFRSGDPDVASLMKVMETVDI